MCVTVLFVHTVSNSVCLCMWLCVSNCYDFVLTACVQYQSDQQQQNDTGSGGRREKAKRKSDDKYVVYSPDDDISSDEEEHYDGHRDDDEVKGEEEEGKPGVCVFVCVLGCNRRVYSIVMVYVLIS